MEITIVSQRLTRETQTPNTPKGLSLTLAHDKRNL